MRTAAIVLAAGKSSRMGTNKLLLKVDGETVLGRLLDILTRVVDEVVVVTGYNPTRIATIAQAHGACIVHNPEYKNGMSTSFQAGLKVVHGFDAAFLVLGDQLGLKLELLRRMITAMEDFPTALIISPIYREKRGHPVLIKASLFDEIINLSDSLKDIIDRHSEVHVFVEGTEWSTIDFDTPKDFEKAMKMWRKEN